MITELAGWRWVFAINVPIGLVALVPAGRLLPSGARAGRRPLDVAGAVLVTAGIAVGVLGLSWISEDAGSAGGWAALGRRWPCSPGSPRTSAAPSSRCCRAACCAGPACWAAT